MGRKTAHVVATDRQADVYLFLRVVKCFIWVAVSILFYKSNERYRRHGVAVILMDAKTGEVLSPTPHTFGTINDPEEEQERIEKCRRKCELLRAYSDFVTSSQISAEDGGAIRIGKGTGHELIIGLAGLKGHLDEAVGFAACLRVWPLSSEEQMGIRFRQGIGPNSDINDTAQYHDILKATHLRDKNYKDFNPDFDKLENLQNYII